ncbi:MAG: hypothetical protein M3004_14010, partial [Bacteroidota bacterium]|nr:hypothetical protein [Bacteroidota bacterium]
MRAWLKKYLFILFLFTLANSTHAQMPGVKHFKFSDGDKIKILSLFKNNNGYIYLGTTKGLYKFDGIKFTIIPFQNNPITNPAITSIFQDDQNQLWVGLQSGDIAKLVNNSLKFFVPQEGTPKKPITAFLQDRQKNIWFATDGEG